MYTTSRAPLRVSVTVVLAVALALSMVGRADADTFPKGYRYAESVDLAGAAWTRIDDDASTHVTLMLAESAGTADRPGMTRYPPSITLFYDRWAKDPATGATSHVSYELLDSVPAAGFSFDRSLRGATARFDAILRGGNVCRYPGGGPPDGLVPGASEDELEEEDDCNRLPDLPVRISLDWTGEGDAFHGASRFRELEPSEFTFFGYEVLAARDASVTGAITIDTLDVPAELVWPTGAADAGVLLRGRQREQLVVPR
jgi:hypothetical protein